MNAKIPCALVMAASLLAAGQETPAPASPAATPAPAPASTPADVPVSPSPDTAPPVRNPGLPPIVRLPVPDEPPAPGTPAPDTQQLLGWSSDSVGLRTRPDSVRTNRTVRTRGAVPKVVRPQKRTFGGFVASFANLFNPLAPIDQGVGVGSDNWYDGRNNAAPLPRGFRDERGHEPSALIFSTPLGPDREPDPEPAPRAAPVPSP
jgi:hypothetical protein